MAEGSIAQKLDIKAGSSLLSIDGCGVIDVLDYRFYSASECLKLDILLPDGKKRSIGIEKDFYEDIGLEFESGLMSPKRGCANKCVFCFIDQLPKGMRKTLYFKDDDWRLSFLMGNYITLSNVNDDEFQRIIRLRANPLYISLHAADDDIRVMMTGNPGAKPLMQRLEELAQNGMFFHLQLVLCPDINDGVQLERTLEVVSGLHPYAKTVAVVPVGLTKWRDGLFNLRAYDKKSSLAVIKSIEKYAAKEGFAYAADEFYIMAELPLPSYESYNDFEQLENGVGMLRKFEREFDASLSAIMHNNKRKLSLVTGEHAKSFMQALSDKVKSKGIDLQIFAVKNNYFGDQVTCAGLLTGGDIISQLKGGSFGEELLFPSSMLRDDGDVFLDDIPPAKIAEELSTKFTCVEPEGDALITSIF